MTEATCYICSGSIFEEDFVVGVVYARLKHYPDGELANIGEIQHKECWEGCTEQITDDNFFEETA